MGGGRRVINEFFSDVGFVFFFPYPVPGGRLQTLITMPFSRVSSFNRDSLTAYSPTKLGKAH